MKTTIFPSGDPATPSKAKRAEIAALIGNDKACRRWVKACRCKVTIKQAIVIENARDLGPRTDVFRSLIIRLQKLERAELEKNLKKLSS